MAKLDLDELFPKRKELFEAAEKAGGFCGEQFDGFGCTLPKNHEGDHIAHGTLATVCSKWSQSGESREVRA